MKLRTRREKRRLRQYGLRRRNEVLSKREVREIIKREIEGPSSLPFLKTEQLYHNGILFQSSAQWQISHLTNCATNFSVRVSLKFHIDGRKKKYIDIACSQAISIPATRSTIAPPQLLREL